MPWQFFGDFPAATLGSQADDVVYCFRQWKDREPASSADTDHGYQDEKWLELEVGLCEEGQSQINENEILGKLGEDLEDEFGRELRTA